MTSDWEAAVRSPTRLAAVAQSGLVGIGPEDPFDRLIELAVELIGVQRGVIALVDAERTTAMSSAGFPEGLALFAPSISLSAALSSVLADRSSLRTRTTTLGRVETPQLKLSVPCRGLGIPLKMPTGWYSGRFASWIRTPTNGRLEIYRFWPPWRWLPQRKSRSGGQGLTCRLRAGLGDVRGVERGPPDAAGCPRHQVRPSGFEPETCGLRVRGWMVRGVRSSL